MKEVQRQLDGELDLSKASITSKEVRLSALIIAHAIFNPCRSDSLGRFYLKPINRYHSVGFG